MPRVAGQIDLVKSEAILDAAAAVLSERGLAAPMEAIARQAGVSKQTVYNHYGSKAELVRALMSRRAETITAILRDPEAAGNPEDALSTYAALLLRAVNNRRYSLMRVTMQSAGEMPDLAREVFQSGSMNTRKILADFLALEARAGRLDISDPIQAAEFFGGMVTAHYQIQALFGLAEEFTEDFIERTAREAARRFIRAYAP
jgi:TetR/AcrR family transcriptional repressor of mexJK operon